MIDEFAQSAFLRAMDAITEGHLELVCDGQRHHFGDADSPLRATIHVHDCRFFRRALLQILENARKYAPPGSPIVVRAQRDVGGTTIAVLDRGSGISSDEMERIFDKFYRGRKGRQKTEGTGMGLAIAKAIVTAHQGRIYAENRAGGGAAIIIRLP